MSDQLIALTVTAGTVAGYLLQLFREGRNRRWLREDQDRREVRAAASASQLRADIQANTAISQQAFRKADEGLEASNGMNEKFIKIHERMEQQQQEQRENAALFRQKLNELDALLPPLSRRD